MKILRSRPIIGEQIRSSFSAILKSCNMSIHRPTRRTFLLTLLTNAGISVRFNHNTLLFTFLILCSTGSLADAVNFNLNNRAFFVGYSHLPVKSNASFSGSLLHHADNGDLVSGQFHIEQNLYDVNTDFVAGIGARAVYVDAKQVDGGALALSGSLKYMPPQNSKISISTVIDYAPEVVSFMDLEAFLEAKLTLNYQLIDHASAYLGARSVKMDFKQGKTTTFESGIFFGISVDL